MEPFELAAGPASLKARITIPGAIHRILIVRLSAMGDVIHTLPAAHFLRQALPQAHIGWLIEERWAQLLCAPGSSRRGPRSPLRPLADEVHTVNLKAWGRSLFSLATSQAIATVVNDVRGADYQAALDLQGAIRSALLAKWSGAPLICGAADPRESPASLLYSRKVVTRGRHVIEQNLSITQAFAEPFAGKNNETASASTGCDLPRDPRAEEQADRRLAVVNIKDFAILNPGAGWGAKRWPAERYGEVAQSLARQGLRSIVNYGPGEEALAQAVVSSSGDAALAMKFTITELIALTRRARLFLGGDTGPLHLAAALHVPIVAIYGPTDPARTGPYGTHSIVLRNPHSIISHARHQSTEEGMLEIGSDTVIQAAKTLVDKL